MKKIILLLPLILLVAKAFAYDFSAVAPNGQTLYYNISGQNAIVTHPNHIASTDEPEGAWIGFTKPTGDLVIPTSVAHGGLTYVVTAIDSCAFWGCEGITRVVFHDSITVIGEGAFTSCYSITEVVVGEGLTQLGKGAFFDCPGITHVVFNAVNCVSNNTHVFDYYDSINFTFAHNTNLTQVEFGSNVQRIPGRFLQDCEGVVSITLPASVTTIGTRAFLNCGGLTEILAMPVVAPQLESRAFDYVSDTIPVYIRCGSLSSYTSQWTHFSNFVEENASYQILATSADEEMGEVEITVMPHCSSNVAVVNAVAHEGYHFVRWSNNNTSNPYTLTLTSDTAITAFFEQDMPEQYTVVAESGDASMGSVSGGGTYDEGTSVTLTAIPNEGYHFMHWSNGETSNPYTFILISDTAITAFFEQDIPGQYTVVVESGDASMGSVSGGGTYDEGTLVTLTAIPNEGCRFVHWSNGETSNPYTFTLLCDTLFTAFFEAVNTQSIPDVMGATILCINGEISIKGVEGEPVAIFDIAGRLLLSDVVSPHRTYALPQRGVYLVKVGSRAAQKVVVR